LSFRRVIWKESEKVPTTKMTKRAIERLPAPHPSGKQTLFWDVDRDPPGWGVLVSGTTKAKTIVVQRKLPGGLTRRMTVTSFGTATDLDAARKTAVEVLDEIRRGNDPKAARRSAAGWTLKRALDEYLAARKDLAPKSVKGYRRSVERHLKPWLDLPLKSITREMVGDRHRKIKDETDRGEQAGPIKVTGEATANAAMRALRVLYNFAADRALELLPNPVRLRKQWFDVAPRERVVRSDELPAFWAAVDALENRTHRDFVALLLSTGLRRSEAAALRWDEVDFANRVIRLPARRTKAGRRLDLPMCDFVRNLLIARRALGNDGGWVFGADSASGHLEEPREAFDKVAAATGIRVSPHDMRRVYITVAESSDISPLALKALVNHSLGKNEVTSSYIQLTVERLREPAQKVCDRMMELCGIAAPEGVARVG
jgi:integrase